MSVAVYPPGLDVIRRQPNATKFERRVTFDDLAQMQVGPRAGIPLPTVSEQMNSVAFRHAEGMMISAAQNARATQLQGDYAGNVMQQMSAQSGVPLQDMETLAEEPPGVAPGLARGLIASMQRVCAGGRHKVTERAAEATQKCCRSGRPRISR